MLATTVKLNQKIKIGQVTIVVTGATKDRFTLAIDAPGEMPIVKVGLKGREAARGMRHNPDLTPPPESA